MGTKEHKKDIPKNLRVGIVTLSTTRTLKEDISGNWIAEHLEQEGHEPILHTVVKDKKKSIQKQVLEAIKEHAPHALILTGGTGLAPHDVTIEAVSPLFEKELSAFGPLFAQLSYGEIGSSAIMSRATAGIIGNTAVFCLPGSLKACQLACNVLIFPELGHISKHVSEK